jgi:hypothetical protein
MQLARLMAGEAGPGRERSPAHPAPVRVPEQTDRLPRRDPPVVRPGTAVPGRAAQQAPDLPGPAGHRREQQTPPGRRSAPYLVQGPPPRRHDPAPRQDGHHATDRNGRTPGPRTPASIPAGLPDRAARTATSRCTSP